MIETKFKHTEIGLIPHDWEVKKIGEIAEYRRGSFPQPYGLPEWYGGVGAMPFVQVADVGDDFRLNPSTKQTISLKGQEYSVYVPKNTVLVTLQGSIGRVAITQYDSYVDRTLAIFQNYNVPIANYYFAHQLCKRFAIEREKAPGGIIKTITKEAFTEFPIPLPPTTAEQERIADALSKIDSLIVDLDALLEKKRAIKTGTMQQLLTGKKRLKGFTGEWVEKTIEEISELRKGGGLSKEKLDSNGKHKCILYGEIFTTYNYQVETCKSRTNYEEGLPSKIGDVLMPGSTTTKGIDLAKAVCVNEDDILLGGDIIVIRNSKQAFDPLFLATYLSEINKQAIAEIAQGITIIHIHAKQIAEVKLLIPPTVEEQRAIASILSAMDTEIASLEQKRDKYIAIKLGMMQQLLTGKIRLV